MVPVSAEAANQQLTKEYFGADASLAVAVRMLNEIAPAEEPLQANTRSLLASIDSAPPTMAGALTMSCVGATRLSVNAGTSAPAAPNVMVSPPLKRSLSVGTAGTMPYSMVPALYSRENVGVVPPMASVPALATGPVGGA